MKILELVGGLGVIALICVGVYFLITRLEIKSEPLPFDPEPKAEPEPAEPLKEPKS